MQGMAASPHLDHLKALVASLKTSSDQSVTVDRALLLGLNDEISKASTEQLVESATADDLLSDLANRLHDLRAQLAHLAKASKDDAAQLRARAVRALEGDDLADDSMRVEFGFDSSALRDHEDPDDIESETELTTSVGACREDRLGNRYRVVQVADEDVRVRLETEVERDLLVDEFLAYTQPAQS